MCGRFTLTLDVEELRRVFPFSGDGALASLGKRYNVAPGQTVLAVGLDRTGTRVGSGVLWGLVPRWSRDGKAFINARVETVAAKPSFRDAFRRSRVVVPADGWYEWARTDRGKEPYRIVPEGGGVLLFAAVADRWRTPEGLEVEGLALVTRPAAEEVAWIHPRMPLALGPDLAEAWLAAPQESWSLSPPDPPRLTAYRVSTRVNRAGVEDPDLIQPLV